MELMRAPLASVRFTGLPSASVWMQLGPVVEAIAQQCLVFLPRTLVAAAELIRLCHIQRYV